MTNFKKRASCIYPTSVKLYHMCFINILMFLTAMYISVLIKVKSTATVNHVYIIM